MILLWWAWIAAALVLGVLELVLPGFVLLGFSLGAAGTGLTLAALGPTALPGSSLWVVFGALSLVSWLALRQFFPPHKREVTHIDHDINDTHPGAGYDGD